jgi:DNA-directed RNA polymerase subunit RPC12/RpoP
LYFQDNFCIFVLLESLEALLSAMVVEMIKFICTKCKHKVGALEKFAGKRVHCPKCKTPLQVPNSVEKTDSQEQHLIRFCCSSCNQKFAVSPDYAGKQVRCSKCKNALRVPNLKKEPLEKELAVDNGRFGDIFRDDSLTAELLSAEASAPRVEEPLKVKPPSPEPPSTQPQSFDSGPYVGGLPRTFDRHTTAGETKGGSKIFLALGSRLAKILAILMLVIFVVWGIAKIIKIDFSVSLGSITEEEDGGTAFYDIWTKGGSYKDIIGASLPDTATDAHGSTLTRGCHGGYILPRCSWIVATLPKEDFYDLVEKIGLVRKPDLLEFWPKAFDCHQDDFQRFWDVQNVVNEDTYFGMESGEETWRVFKYEDGKLYIKKVTRFVTIGFANSQARYQKKGPAAIGYIVGAPLTKAATDKVTQRGF